MFKNESKNNFYMRTRIREAREEAGISQEDLARFLEKSRVAISDLERGRVSVNAEELMSIAAYLRKPITFFYPPRKEIIITPDQLSPLEQEIIINFRPLPEPQQLIAIENLKQLRRAVEKAEAREAEALLLDDTEA